MFLNRFDKSELTSPGNCEDEKTKNVCIVKLKCSCNIIETFGSGNAPTYKWFIEELKTFLDKGGIILNITQCHGGSVEMGLYETSREMLKAGVLSGKDITSEASVTKLMHLLGTISDRKLLISSINRSLAGEIT